MVCDFLSEGFSEVGEIAGKTKSHFPRLVFACAQKLLHCVDTVLFLGHVLSHWNQRFQAKNADSILVVVGKLSEDWKQLLELLVLGQLG